MSENSGSPEGLAHIIKPSYTTDNDAPHSGASIGEILESKQRSAQIDNKSTRRSILDEIYSEDLPNTNVADSPSQLSRPKIDKKLR